MSTKKVNRLTYPKMLELLRDRALNDSDEQLREWVQGQLSKMDSGKISKNGERDSME
jgi:hypothetical protein